MDLEARKERRRGRRLGLDSPCALGVQVLTVEGFNLLHTVQLVHDHDHMYSKRRCIFCDNTVHKKDIRHCPDPERIQEYYSLSTEFSVSISEDSVLCSPCYHAQLAIVNKTVTHQL